ncbi:MAG: DUF455 family protein [Candidatus Latescibacterota bacterium]|nr:DUF455 family protein [Candidatus Latescibacterota bacterium]
MSAPLPSAECMEIRELAEFVLFANTIDGKLIKSGRLTDEHPGKAIVTPDGPGRPAELGLDGWGERDKVPFHDVRQLRSERDGGLVMHFFANHELLALELMALVLLRFPKAPAKFRRGVAETLKEEQEHVCLYLERMAAVGVEFGELPVSDFFWRAISPMASPLDFVSGLSLTLEQANLDYAPHYARFFAELGDEQTAALMEKIYRDEIGHVKHGLNWFRQWEPTGADDWRAFRQVLAPPLSPSRAKGVGGFNREGRERAGLTTDFIDELEIYNQSKGRCPSVYWFNPTCDLNAGRNVEQTPNAGIVRMRSDLESVAMFLASLDDVVLVERRPSTDFLRSLYCAGIPVPELVEVVPVGGAVPTELRDRQLGDLRPWGWDPESAKKMAPLFAQLSPGARRDPGARWNEGVRGLYAKSFGVEVLRTVLTVSENRELLCPRSAVGCALDTLAEVQTIAAEPSPTGRHVIKADFGASGVRQIIVNSGAFERHQCRWVESAIHEMGAVVVEPWLDRVLDLSAQFEIDDEGTIRLVGITRFLAGGRGRWLGAFLQQMVAGLGIPERRFLYGDGKDDRRLTRIFEVVGEVLAPELQTRGFVGAFGVDAFVYRDETSVFRLKPVVEVNPRFTMGRVALNLAKTVNTARTALWLALPIRHFSDREFSEIARTLKERHPIEMTPDGEQISTGLLFTTDPRSARQFATAMCVGRNLDEVKAMFDGVDERLGAWREHC